MILVSSLSVPGFTQTGVTHHSSHSNSTTSSTTLRVIHDSHAESTSASIFLTVVSTTHSDSTFLAHPPSSKTVYSQSPVERLRIFDPVKLESSRMTCRASSRHACESDRACCIFWWSRADCVLSTHPSVMLRVTATAIAPRTTSPMRMVKP